MPQENWKATDNIRRRATTFCPHGERDNTAFSIVLMCLKEKLPIEEAYHWIEVFHQHVEQPPNDYHPLELYYEKVHRKYKQARETTHICHLHGDTSPPKWRVSKHSFPDFLHGDNLSAALAYLAAGISVVPTCWTDEDGRCVPHGKDCSAPGKRPLVKWKEYQQRLPTEEEVRSWWEKYPEANIAGITGRISRFFVLDFDTKDKFFKHPQRDFWIENTPVVETARGFHVYLRYDQEVHGTRMAGVDVKGEGGYVILPPSIHATGFEYTRVDHAEGSIVHITAGLAAYISEALEAGDNWEKKFSFIPKDFYADPPEAVISALENYGGKYYQIAQEMRMCGYYYNWWKDKNEHRALIPKRCKHRGHGCQTRYLTRAYLERTAEIWESIQEPYLLLVPLGSSYKAHDRFKKLRKQLKAIGVVGDLAEVPTGEADDDGWPIMAAVGVVDRQSIVSISKADILTAYIETIESEVSWQRVKTTASAAMLYVIAAAESGAALWSKPDLWLSWYLDYKGLHKVRGIDNGGRTVSRPRDKRVIRCPICGEEMYRDRSRESITRDEASRRLKTGHLVIVEGTLVEASTLKPSGSQEKEKRKETMARLL